MVSGAVQGGGSVQRFGGGDTEIVKDVLDGSGQVTDINVGFTTGEVLRRQLVDAGMPVAA